MTSRDHVSCERAWALTGDGACRVSDLLLTMPGRWEITLQLSRPGERDQALLSPVLR